MKGYSKPELGEISSSSDSTNDQGSVAALFRQLKAKYPGGESIGLGYNFKYNGTTLSSLPDDLDNEKELKVYEYNADFIIVNKYKFDGENLKQVTEVKKEAPADLVVEKNTVESEAVGNNSTKGSEPIYVPESHFTSETEVPSYRDAYGQSANPMWETMNEQPEARSPASELSPLMQYYNETAPSWRAPQN